MAQRALTKMGRKNQSLLMQMRRYLPFYLFLLIPIAQVIIFNYVPMYGIIIAFKDFKMRLGILGSEWVGLEHFQRIFGEANFYQVLFNTIRLSCLSFVTSFPLTVIFALMMNEVHNMKFKRISQTITYLPHFLSWIVVGNFVFQILSPTYGIVNAVLLKLGVLQEPIYFMVQKNMFTPIYLVTNIWKSLGWSIIIYLASIAGIDPGLYEAAAIDGAGRFRKVLHVTLPGIMPTISTLLILQMGSLINVGFDPIFNLYTDATYEVADVISTYVYRRGLVNAKYSYTAAIGLFQNVVSIILVLGSNFLARKANPDFRIL